MSSQSEQPPEDHLTAGSDMVGRDDFMRSLVGQLICDADDSSELRVISVVGKTAIGKTATVRSVYDRLDIKRHFKSRAWVRVLVGSGVVDILFDVLKQTTTYTLKGVDCLQESHLSHKLRKTFIEQRCLVVLDNLRCVDPMKQLLISFANSRNGSRVIITTCEENTSLCPEPRLASHLYLSGLTKEESRELLRKSCRTGDPEITESILDKCHGYPPMIQLLGLASTDREAHRSFLADGDPNNFTVREITSLSYKSLPSWLKPCLLFLVLFPRESEIPIRRLFNIWVADGVVCGQEHEHSTWGCHDASGALNELVLRKMIHVVRHKLDGKAKMCLMPGFLHDFLSEMAITDVRDSEISDYSMSTSSRKPRLPSIAVNILMSAIGGQCKQMHMSNDAKTQCDAKFFRSSLFFTSCKLGEHAKEIEMFLKSPGFTQCFSLLKVLDLEHVYKPVLPKRLGKIVPNLRYLGLRWTALVSLPRSVQSMSHLDTLDLKHTNVASVPSSILKKGSLQHLYMNGVCLDRSFRRKASYQKSLANLKTLWGLHIGVKSAMLDALSKLTGLRKLALTSHYVVANNVANSLARLTNLESLRWSSVDTFDHTSTLELSGMSNLQSLLNLHLIGKLKNGLSGLPKKLNILTLSMTQLAMDQMKVLGELKNLMSLKLFAGSYKGQSMTCTKGTFPKLRVLKLWKLKLLKKWIIKASALPCLQELEIRNCKKLTDIVGLEHVKCLKEITLTEVEGAVVTTAENECPGAVVIERGLAISPPQEGHDINKEEDNEESHGVEAEGGDDKDLEETDSDDNSGTDEQIDEQDDNEEDGNEESNGEVGHGNDNEQGDSNGDTRTDGGADEKQENEEEAAIGNEDGNGDKDKDENDYQVGEEDEDRDENDDEEGEEDEDKDENDDEEGEEDEDKDENDDEEGDDGGGNEGGGGGGGDVNEEENDNREKEEENDNGEQQIADETADENENGRDEKGDDGNSGQEEEKDKRNEAEARDGDDSDHERADLNDDDDEGETKSCKMNMKLELNMETEANVKNELTLTVVWKKTKDDKKRKS